jgi:hypothetical protein
MLFSRFIVACCFLMLALSMPAQAQSAEERYIADRDAAVARFTPERVPKIEKPQMDDEEKARAALEKQLFALIGTAAPKGFGKPKSNLGSLFTGDMDFGKLDGVVFEADGGNGEMLVTTMSLLQRWLKSQTDVPGDLDKAMRSTDFLLRAIQTDAAILQYAEIPLGAPRAFAMLANRTQDNAPTDVREVIVTAVRGDRFYVAHADIAKPFEISACSSARAAREKKIEALSNGSAKPGESNDAFSKRLETLRDQSDSEFLKCFAENVPKDPRFAAAVARAKDLFERMPAK